MSEQQQLFPLSEVQDDSLQAEIVRAQERLKESISETVPHLHRTLAANAVWATIERFARELEAHRRKEQQP